jgi:uncharacterized repeat protein (TIGR01451 family)
MKKLYFSIVFTTLALFSFGQAPTANDFQIVCDNPSMVYQVFPIDIFIVDAGGGIDYNSFDLDMNQAGFQHTKSFGSITLNYDPIQKTLIFQYSDSGCNNDGINFYYKVNSLGGESSNISQIFTFINQFNFPPTSFDDNYEIVQGSSLYENPTTNDVTDVLNNFSNFTLFNQTPTPDFWVSNSNNFFEFTPNIDFVGIATALYTTTNMCGISNAGLITINVIPNQSIKSIGKVYNDENSDCIKQELEAGINGVLLTIQPGNLFFTSNSNGQFLFDSIPDGEYTATIALPNNLWSTTCGLTQSFTIINNEVATPIEFGLHSSTTCTEPKVSIVMPTIRRCFSEQMVYVKACNENTATSTLENAYVDVKLDFNLSVNAASLPFTSLGNNLFRFDVGNIGIGQCKNFTINTTVSCGTQNFQTLCLEANLMPVESCTYDTIITNPTFPNGVTPCTLPWDRSSLSVNGWCANDSIYFTIRNGGEFGNGDMDCYSPVRVYIDGQMYQFDTIRLVGQETVTYAFAGTGQTWRLEADQHPLHPGNSRPNASVELCGNQENWTPGLVTILPQDDASPVKDIFCGSVTGSYDPNDKQGFPSGVTASHFIMPNQDIEYLIRFQNTGNDTAFTVVIRDTLALDFDIFSVVSGVSSHDYTFTMYGPRVLEWTFNNILLPDSTTNQEASNGFVTFRVKQNLDLANGTQLTNSADIYFDFNDPIITNQTLHTVNSCIQNSSVSSISVTQCDTYTAADGQVYTESGVYTAVIPNHLDCDSTITINLTINHSSTVNITEVACGTYTAADGTEYTESGMYTAVIPTMMGCDSTIMIDLTINQASNSSITANACGTYLAPDGMMYTQEGTYTAIIPNAAGCDSTITIELTSNNTFASIDVDSGCETYTAPDGQTYMYSGIYTAILPNAAECDSIITIHLTTNNTSSMLHVNACGEYLAPNGDILTESGEYTYTIPNQAECDSMIMLHLTINHPQESSITEIACGTYTAPDGMVYTESGTYTAMLTTEAGCDSTITINLTINEATTTNLTVNACGSYLAPDGMEYTAVGIYTFNFISTAGCDSTIILDLTINQSSTSVLNDIVCQSYIAPDGMVYTEAGTYTAIIANAAGCDSIVTINLTTNNTTSSITEVTTCEPYVAPDGQIYSLSGTYTAIIPNEIGCDSIITIVLTTSNTSNTINEIACVQVTLLLMEWFIESGTYTAILPNEIGCDSIITIHLNINNSFVSITETACDTYFAPDGQEFTESGIYNVVIPTTEGCDSTITIDLTVNHSTTSSISVSSCGIYTAPDGIEYDMSGMYVATIPNAMGCDSLINIDLTINEATSSTIEVSACGFYTAADGMVYTESGMYMATIANANGCDSLITINLTMTETSSSSITASACQTYTAPNGTVYTTSGVYEMILTNANGCDSIVTINLTIKQNTTRTLNVTQCGAYTAPDGIIYASTGTYTSIIPNAGGCDSIITINLNVNIVNTAIQNIGGVLTALADGATSYQWINCANDQPVAGATNQTFTPTQAGEYKVTITAGGCTGTSICLSGSAASIADIQLNRLQRISKSNGKCVEHQC